MWAGVGGNCPIPAMATRHEPVRSTRAPLNSRPLIPPMALPPTYKPIAAPKPAGSTSSPRYAMATAGTPLMATPLRKRKSSRRVQLGVAAAARFSATTANSDTLINDLRPSRSDSAPAASSETARPMVAADTARLDPAAPTPNCRDSKGSSGCMQ
jgi:hypothetical protein